MALGLLGPKRRPMLASRPTGSLSESCPPPRVLCIVLLKETVIMPSVRCMGTASTLHYICGPGGRDQPAELWQCSRSTYTTTGHALQDKAVHERLVVADLLLHLDSCTHPVCASVHAPKNLPHDQPLWKAVTTCHKTPPQLHQTDQTALTSSTSAAATKQDHTCCPLAG